MLRMKQKKPKFNRNYSKFAKEIYSDKLRRKHKITL